MDLWDEVYKGKAEWLGLGEPGVQGRISECN